jgi:hypothetical protein
LKSATERAARVPERERSEGAAMAAERSSMSIRRLGAGLLLLTLVAGPASANVLYRWVNDQGNKETAYAIPPDYVHRGYEILDKNSMRVLKVVPPELSAEEYEEKKRMEAAKAACEAALDRVNFLYERLSDIDAAEVRALRNLEGRIQSTQQNLTNARKRLELYETEAARLERQGQSITRELLADIERANRSIGTLELQIQQREAEKENKRVEFDEERALFGNQSCAGTAFAYR